MKMKRLVSSLTAAALVATALTTSQIVFADATFASANDFITDVVNTALTDVTSATKANAIATMQGKLTTSGDAVLYDGTTIGYWYSDASTTLYTDDTKTETLFTKSATGYNVDPTLLGTLLTDINNNLVDTYTPTTDDWSKIVGKYDIKLGDITIPAAQWIQAEATDGVDPLFEGKSVNISRLSGIDNSTIPSSDNYFYTNDAERLYVCSWLIDDTGTLYLQNQLTSVYKGGSNSWLAHANTLDDVTITNYDITNYDAKSSYTLSTGTTARSSTTLPLIKAGLVDKETGLYARIYAANATNTMANCLPYENINSTTAKLCSIDEPAIINTCLIENAKAYGVVYFTGAQSPNINGAGDFAAQHSKMFDSHSASKQITGNTVLAKRLMKIASLEDTDALTVASTGWLVNDTENIDEYMASQNIITAGETAEIDTTVDIAPLSFNVIVPTTLPVDVATDGTITTASNATVTNKSNAAVRITNISITEKPECGWTLVASNPSTVRDAKEFTFTTSLTSDTVLASNEVLPFTYNAKLSPLTEGADSLDLATVSVTVDWAD